MANDSVHRVPGWAWRVLGLLIAGMAAFFNLQSLVAANTAEIERKADAADIQTLVIELRHLTNTVRGYNDTMRELQDRVRSNELGINTLRSRQSTP